MRYPAAKMDEATVNVWAEILRPFDEVLVDRVLNQMFDDTKMKSRNGGPDYPWDLTTLRNVLAKVGAADRGDARYAVICTCLHCGEVITSADVESRNTYWHDTGCGVHRAHRHCGGISRNARGERLPKAAGDAFVCFVCAQPGVYEEGVAEADGWRHAGCHTEQWLRSWSRLKALSGAGWERTE